MLFIAIFIYICLAYLICWISIRNNCVMCKLSIFKKKKKLSALWKEKMTKPNVLSLMQKWIPTFFKYSMSYVLKNCAALIMDLDGIIKLMIGAYVIMYQFTLILFIKYLIFFVETYLLTILLYYMNKS